MGSKVSSTCQVCGAEFKVYACWAKRGGGKFCSKACKDNGASFEDISGSRFGRLKVICRIDRKYKNHALWHCRCDCGNEVNVRTDALKSGHTKSCGCYHNDVPWIVQDDRDLAIRKGLYLQTIVKKNKERGLSECISLQEYLRLSRLPCHYCGAVDTNSHRDELRSGKVMSHFVVRYNGIDRVDSSKGYAGGNVVPCCKHCNIAKGNKTVSQFYEWLARAYNHSFSQRAAIHA